jgi:hypothetical protein
VEKETKVVDRGRLVNVGVDFTQNDFVEGNLQLENLKKMLISIREEDARWLGLIDLGLVRMRLCLLQAQYKVQHTTKWLCWERERIVDSII